MSVLYGATCIVGIIFMLTFMFVGIWLCITASKSFLQLRYKNYILEKIYQKLDTLVKKSLITPSQKEDEEEIDKEYENAFDLNPEDKLSKLSEIKKFNSMNNIK